MHDLWCKANSSQNLAWTMRHWIHQTPKLSLSIRPLNCICTAFPRVYMEFPVLWFSTREIRAVYYTLNYMSVMSLYCLNSRLWQLILCLDTVPEGMFHSTKTLFWTVRVNPMNLVSLIFAEKISTSKTLHYIRVVAPMNMNKNINMNIQTSHITHCQRHACSLFREILYWYLCRAL